MTASQPNLEALLSHQDWVRALARSLVADPSRADDIAQQTMLEAMTRPPRDLSRPKGWLAQVARNTARAFARQESRRRRREQAVATSDEVTADPADAAHRAAAHKRLVDALFELEEPYHTVVLLRFFEDLEARDIAAHLDRPVATVRTQLQRGLERMRQRLDRESGGRAAWCAALVPLFANKQAVVSVPVLTLGAFVMTKWILPAVAVLLALFVGYAVVDGYWHSPAPVGGAPADAAPIAQAADQPVDQTPQRDAVATVPAAPDAPEPVAPAATGVAGRAVTVDGAPVPGLVIAWRDPEMPRLDGTYLWYGNTGIDLDQPSLRPVLADPRGVAFFARDYAPYEKVVEALIRGEPLELPRATTDGQGHFRIDAAKDLANLQIEGSDWIRYGDGQLPGEPSPVLIVGPGVRVAGRIVDHNGAPLQRVYVSMGFSIETLPGVAQQFEQSSGYRSWNENTNAAGEFDCGMLPAHPQLSITAQKRGYVTLSVAPTEVTGPVIWTLREQPAADRRILSGHVRHADGSVAAGAVLRFGGDGGKADDNGRFEFELGGVNARAPLTAYLKGLQPAVVNGLGRRLWRDPAAGRNLVLTLGGPTLQISGRVLDADGRPLGGVRVMLADGTPHGTFYGSLESWMADQSEDGDRTDDDGRFTLRELSDRSYTVRALDEQSLLVIESEPIPAGTTDLVLRGPRDAFVPRVEGLLVDRFGQPVVGAEVDVQVVLQRSLNGNRLRSREPTVTSGSDGRFVLANCPRRHADLWIHGDGLKGVTLAVPTDGQPIRVVVPRLLKFALRAASSPGASSFGIVDADGARLSITANLPDVTRMFDEHDVPAGNSPVYEVVDTAAQLVLLDGEREVRRIALHLLVGQLNQVDL